MSERRPGFPPENPAVTTGEKKEEPLSSEQMQQIEALGRYFGTFFSGVKIEHRTAEDQQILEKRFASFLKFIDAKKFLTAAERQDLIEKMKERVHFSDPIEEASPTLPSVENSEQPLVPPAETKPVEVLPVKPKKKRATPQKKALPTIAPEQKEEPPREGLLAVFGEIIASSGCSMSIEDFKINFLGNLRLVIPVKLSFEDLTPQNLKKEGNKFVFYTQAQYQGNKESIIKCEVSFTTVKRGLPGNQKIEQIPKWFMIPLSK